MRIQADTVIKYCKRKREIKDFSISLFFVIIIITREDVMILNDIAAEFSKLNSVNSVVLSGSKTSLINDDMSDYDVYVYSSESIPLEIREDIIKKFTDKYTIGNTFFEDGDELSVSKPKIYIDIMYRNLDWAYKEMNWVWSKHNARLGYTTAFIHNLKTSKILYDRNYEFERIIDELKLPYPEELKQSIIDKNYPMLRTLEGAPYYKQVELAVKRDDLVSQNHRTAALLASYFDILFAYNLQTHPGEKKLIQYAKKYCKHLPKDFEDDVSTVIKSVGSPQILQALTKLLDELDVFLGK